MEPEPQTVVFLGPSLARAEAKTVLKAHYLPPARQGDVYRLLGSGVKRIVLIDGVFHAQPAVWQRELLAAIDEGIEVYGAASMGALRAAELCSLGMIGYGTVFEWYRDGVIDGDDEVALWHCDEDNGFRPLSEPLVNIRVTLNEAAAAQCLTEVQARQLVELAKQTYYPQRSYDHLLQASVLQHSPETDLLRLQCFFLERKVDLKKRDAFAVLQCCARTPFRGNAPQSNRAPVTAFKYHPLRCRPFKSANRLVHGNTLIQVLQRNPLLYADLKLSLSARWFMIDWARQNDVRCPHEFLSEYHKHLEPTGIAPGNENRLERNRLTSTEYAEMVEQHAVAAWLTAQSLESFGRPSRSTQSLLCESVALSMAQQTTSALRDSSVSAPSAIVLARRIAAVVEDEALRTAISEREFVLDWAKQNGISCAPNAEPERSTPFSRDQLELLDSVGLTPKTFRGFLQNRFLADWIIKQGPNYFGVRRSVWNGLAEVIRELQFQDRIGDLLEQALIVR